MQMRSAFTVTLANGLGAALGHGAASVRARWVGSWLLLLLVLAAPLARGDGVSGGARPGGGDAMDCLIEPFRLVTLSAAIEGKVSEVLVDRGDAVEEGQVVARLESEVERANLETARARASAEGGVLSRKAQLDFAKRTLERQQALEKRDVVSKSEIDQAYSSKQVAEAELRAAAEAKTQAELELRQAEAVVARREIRSPFRGVVVERILSPGEYADPPQIVKLAQIDPLRVEVFAPLSAYGTIQEGMVAELLPEEPVGGAYQARVTVVDPVVDPASGTFRVRLELPNPDHALPAGLSCRVRFPETVAGNPPTGGPTPSTGASGS